MTFSARFVANIIQFASQQGASSQHLLQLTRYDFSELYDENLRVDASIYNQVIEEAVRLTGDPYFGLHMGEYLTLSAAGIVAQISQTSRTIKEALNYMVQFANLGCQSLPFSLEQNEKTWELSAMPNELWLQQSPISVQQTIDGMMVFTLKEFHSLTRQKHQPLAIHFCRKRPKNSIPYERVFKCPIHFNQKKNALILDEKHVAEPIITSDFKLLRILVQHANEKLARIQEEQGFFGIVKQSILNLVKPQFPTIDQVASNLNISVRTLQRKLKAEGYTYKSMLNELRMQFALDYVKNKNLSIQEIAYLLDYSEPSAFNRSFKRWTGKSPLEYRGE